MAKMTKSVRMSEKTLQQLDELGSLLKESMSDLLELAVDRLYQTRKEVYEIEDAKRRDKLNASK